jgi:hypothetical protein
MDRYTAYLKAQLEELLTNYGPIGILWFDGEWEDTWTHERGKDLYNLRSAAPALKLIINNRVDKGRQGMQGMTKEPTSSATTARPSRKSPPPAARRRLGIVHDHERHLGLQKTTKLEVPHHAHPQPHRHRLQGRQLPAQRRPHRRRAKSPPPASSACRPSANG